MYVSDWPTADLILCIEWDEYFWQLFFIIHSDSFTSWYPLPAHPSPTLQHPRLIDWAVIWAVSNLVLPVEVPRWEVEGSKWNSAVIGICGNHEERWQVRNKLWQVGNNLDWFWSLTALFHLLITQIYPTDFIGSIIDHHDGITCLFYFQSGTFRYIWFNFPEGRKAGIFFLFLIHPEVTWSVSHTSTCSKLWEAWELPLSVPFVKWNRLFWIVEGPPPSMVKLWKTALQTQI